MGKIRLTKFSGNNFWDNLISKNKPIPIFWLKADSLNLNDNDPVTSWTDVTGNIVLTQTGSGGIAYRDSKANGKPVVTPNCNESCKTTLPKLLYNYKIIILISLGKFFLIWI
jgi:hypothetical protein